MLLITLACDHTHLFYTHKLLSECLHCWYIANPLTTFMHRDFAPDTFYLCDCDSAIFLTGTESCYEVTYCNKMMVVGLHRESCFRFQNYTFPSFFIFSSNFSPHSQFSMLLFCFFSISVSHPDLLVHIWSDLFCLTPVRLTTIAATFGWVYDPHWLIVSRPGYADFLPKN